MATNADAQRAFLAASLGVTFGTIDDLTLAFYTKYAAGLDGAYLSKTGDIVHTGTKTGLNGSAPVVKAAAIVSPVAPSVAYVQADTATLKTAIDAIILALKNVGITL